MYYLWLCLYASSGSFAQWGGGWGQYHLHVTHRKKPTTNFVNYA